MVSHLTNKGLSQSGQYPVEDADLIIPIEPRDQWTRTTDGLVTIHKSPTRIIYSLDCWFPEADYEKALNELFQKIVTHKKRDGELVQVDFEFWVAEKWKSILKHLSSLLIHMQKQLSFIGFSETELSWNHLTDLFEIYERFEDPKTFPFIFVDRTEVFSPTSKKFIQDMMMMREEKVKGFLKKIIVDQRSLFSCFENDCFDFYVL